ncbi:hypothetical protein [Evansella tamaricis]|uniref:Secreted protein n=1 Tax=Evansella tamaricis TaxID=2069301 RepID=A0ABS6JIC1_9BACI|nr:hypothetical protein [Evansella tamaricis]MBU9713391.1 hypothetical protein [Evansella tamaricis]
MSCILAALRRVIAGAQGSQKAASVNSSSNSLSNERLLQWQHASDAALRICFELPQRTGRPNIGHATGRGALPDGRILFRAILSRGRGSDFRP